MIKLHNYLKIEKETEKAVAVCPRQITENDLKAIEETFWWTGTLIKGSMFWFPKSQVVIKNGFVVEVSKLIEKKNFIYFDTPIFTENDFKLVKMEKIGG